MTMTPTSYPTEKMKRILALTALVILAASLRYSFAAGPGTVR